VRINDDEGQALPSVYLALTDDEARELIDALSSLLTAKAGWHAHVSDAKYRHEVTVYRDDDATASFGKPS